MKVELISYTRDATSILLFTKNTRLNMVAEGLEAIKKWPEDVVTQELEYMANTIPSSWEFVDYIFSIQDVTRAFTHQLVRTRTGSYAQQSQRVTDMGIFGYRVPPKLAGTAANYYHSCMESIRKFYQGMIAAGADIEDARGVLPTNVYTNIVAKFNLRTLAELARSRTGGRTQDEYREVVSAMADAVKFVHPWAELFLFPQGRDYWLDLETEVAAVTDSAVRRNILKVIDKMRKS